MRILHFTSLGRSTVLSVAVTCLGMFIKEKSGETLTYFPVVMYIHLCDFL